MAKGDTQHQPDPAGFDASDAGYLHHAVAVLIACLWVGDDVLPERVRQVLAEFRAAAAARRPKGGKPRPPQTLEQQLAPYEREVIANTLKQHNGHRQQTADALGINRTTLFKKMRRHGLLNTKGQGE
jgi:DNA-binding NtrC family response regulator